MVSEIVHRITVAEVIVAVIMYIVVRSIIWLLRKAEDIGKNELQRVIHGHVHGRHGGRYRDCDRCDDIITIDEMTI